MHHRDVRLSAIRDSAPYFFLGFAAPKKLAIDFMPFVLVLASCLFAVVWDGDGGACGGDEGAEKATGWSIFWG